MRPPGDAGRAGASCCGPGGAGCERRRPPPLWPPPRPARRAPFPPRPVPPGGLQPGPRSPESRQDSSGQVPPKLGRGKELAVLLFPEARCLSASDGPLQTSFPGEPAGAARGG